MESSAVDLATYVRTPLSPAHVAHLREIGEVVSFAPGETMVAFGAPNEAFFYILEGEAAAWDEVTGQRYGKATLGPTQFTGEMSFLTGGAVQLTNRAATPLTAIRVPRAAMLQAMAGLFVMVGAAPNTGWLAGMVDLDPKGFVLTTDGYVTSVPGIFAVGDVRATSVKRVASAVGEGSVVISKVWEHVAAAPA